MVDRAVFDEKGRAVVDLRWVIGKGRILPLTTMEHVILLKRDPGQAETVREMGAAEALAVLEANGYYNPHLLGTTPEGLEAQKAFFGRLLGTVRCLLFNSGVAGVGELKKIVSAGL